MGTGELNAGGNPAMDWHPIQGGVEILLVASSYRNRDKLRPDGPLGSHADFTLPYIRIANPTLGPRQLRWESCLASADSLSLANGTTFLHINVLARLIGTALGVASVT